MLSGINITRRVLFMISARGDAKHSSGLFNAIQPIAFGEKEITTHTNARLTFRFSSLASRLHIFADFTRKKSEKRVNRDAGEIRRSETR